MGELTRRLRAVKTWLSPELAILLLYFLLFLPFWKPLAAAFICAAACQPVRHYFRLRLPEHRHKWIEVGLWGAIVLTTLVIGTVLARAFASVSELVTDQNRLQQLQTQAVSFKDRLSEMLQGGPVVGELLGDFNLGEALRNLASQLGAFLMEAGRDILMVTPDALLSLFLFVATFGWFFFRGDRLWRDLGRSLGFDGRGESVRAFEDACAVSLGASLLTGAVQTVLVVIGAKISGFEFLSMLVVVTFVLSFVPLFGAGGVAVALALLSLVSGDSQGALIMVVTAGIVGTVDNLLRAWLFSRAAQGNALMSLIALLGSLVIFGAIGLLLAPVIEQLALRVVRNDAKSRSSRKSSSLASKEACI